MGVFQKISTLVEETLSLSEGTLSKQGPDVALLGEIPELDSMAVVSIITSLEEEFGIMIDDDDISAETFATLGSLADYVEEKLA